MAKRYIILDTETTGTGENDRIIQLGYMVLGTKEIEVYNEFFSSDIPISFAAMEVHGITPDMLDGKESCTKSASYKRLQELRLQYFRYKMGLYKNEQSEAKDLGITVKAHDAIGDVLVLKLFLSKLKEEISQLFPQENPVEKMVHLTMTPILINSFNFGKYKGKTLQEVATSDAAYLRWMLGNMEKLDEDMRYSINRVLGN